MAEPRTTKLDANQLRVLAHPLRTRLLGTLRLEGPATATALARSLSTNTGATSYHLRKLAVVGLVEETGEGQGRERWWRAVHDQHSYSTTGHEDPDARAAASWLEGNALRLLQARAEAWLRSADELPAPWREVGGFSDYFLDLSPDQLRALTDELYSVIERYREAGPQGEDARRVFVFVEAFPQAPGDSL